MHPSSKNTDSKIQKIHVLVTPITRSNARQHAILMATVKVNLESQMTLIMDGGLLQAGCPSVTQLKTSKHKNELKALTLITENHALSLLWIHQFLMAGYCAPFTSAR